MLLRGLSTFFILSVLVINGKSQKLPSFIKPCSLADPDLTKCLTSTAQASLKYLENGLPDQNVPSLDPLKVGQIVVDQPSLKVQFDDSVILGLKSCRINELRIDDKNKKIHLNYTKNGSFNAKYNVNGQILIIPLRGDGDCKIKFTNLNYVFVLDYTTTKGKDGKDHWKITKQQVDYGAEKVVFKFTNLFGGNKQLSDTAHRVVNDNSLLIFSDLSPPIMTKVSKRIVNFIEKFFESVPIEDMILP